MGKISKKSRNNRQVNNQQQKNHTIQVWHFLLMFIHAIYLFFEIEIINNPSLWEMKIGYVVLNVVFIYVFLLLLLLLFDSLNRAMVVGSLFYYVFSLVFYYVYLFRGEPFQFIDIFSIGTAMEVADGYTFTVTKDMVRFGVMTVVICVLYLCAGNYRLVRRRRWRLWIRGIAVGSIAVLYVCYLNLSWNGAVGIVTDLYRPYKTYSECGTTVGFLCVAKYMRLTPPEGYSVKLVEEIADSVEVRDEERADLVKPVNIIAIMNEAWADYRLLGEFEVNEPYMPYYDSLTENTIKGHSLVCIQGGGTAKTEYEFLTGNSVKRFPGMVPYVSYFTHDQYSLVSTLKDQGYTVEAMHPNVGTNWKRTSAYRLLGFEKFYTIDEFDEDAKRIRQHISDQANYEKIIEVIEAKDDPSDPYFLFDITMQSHGGYKGTTWSGDVKTIGYHDTEVNRYLSLQKETDEALQYLIEYFEACEEPTIILMFGDHYPSLPESFPEWITGKTFDDSTLEEQMQYFATPFFIWANYGIPEEEGILTSTNYLSTLLLEQTGLQMTPYNYYLQDLRKDIPALNHLGYMDAEGNYVAWEDADEYHENLELQYEAIQYNELAEDLRRVDEFFTVKRTPEIE